MNNNDAQLNDAVEQFRKQLALSNKQNKNDWKYAYLHKINLQTQSINSEKYKLCKN